MKSKLIAGIVLCCCCYIAYTQDSSSFFSRLQAIRFGNTSAYNIDGIEIHSGFLTGEFSKKNISKQLKKQSVKEQDLNQSDTTIRFPNFIVRKSNKTSEDRVENAAYYIIEIEPKLVKCIIFLSINKWENDIEKEFIQHYFNKDIPSDIYESNNIDSINFAGRKIALGGSCRWMGVANVQCPSYGQMNWSIHKTSEDAVKSLTDQYNYTKNANKGKIVSEELVDVIFEGKEVKAKRMNYDFKGVNSLLLGMTGQKFLTIYYISCPLRGNFISCVMSFWNNDMINPSGLPPLLEQVMKLK